MENPVDFEGLGTHVENEEIDGVIDITRLVDERTNSPNSDSIPKTEVLLFISVHLNNKIVQPFGAKYYSSQRL